MFRTPHAPVASSETGLADAVKSLVGFDLDQNDVMAGHADDEGLDRGNFH